MIMRPTRIPSSSWWLHPLVAGLFTSALFAGDDRDTELDRLRQIYHNQLATALEPAVKNYQAKLFTLEQRFAAQGDYPGAIAAKNRIDKLTSQFGALQKKEKNKVTLSPADAVTQGSISLDSRAGLLRRWSTRGSRATWRQKIERGTYQISITYGVAAPAVVQERFSIKTVPTGGSISVRQNRKFSDPPEKTFHLDLNPTGGWESFRTRVLGTLKITTSPTTIEIVVDDVEPGGLMCFKQLVLIPVDEDSTKTGTSSNSQRQLTALKQGFLEESTTLTTAVKERFISALTEIKKQALAAGDRASATAAHQARLFSEKIDTVTADNETTTPQAQGQQ